MDMNRWWSITWRLLVVLLGLGMAAAVLWLFLTYGQGKGTIPEVPILVGIGLAVAFIASLELKWYLNDNHK